VAAARASRSQAPVNNSRAAPALAHERRSIVRTPPRGRVAVADYVGRAAGEAAQALRRAGLRPALDRSPSLDPALVGQVVAQEPPAGSDVARNAFVSLYVAAPAEHGSSKCDFEDGERVLAGVVAQANDEVAASTSARSTWSKPHVESLTTEGHDARVLSAVQGTRVSTPYAQPEPSGRDTAAEASLASCAARGERSHEELLEAASEVFAHRRKRAIARGAPTRLPSAQRKARERMREWTRGQPWTYRAASAALALAALTSTAAALSAHPASVHPPTAAVTPNERSSEVRAAPAAGGQGPHSERRRPGHGHAQPPSRRATGAASAAAPPRIPVETEHPAPRAPGGPFSP
jgi:hypothetical protein